MERDDFHLILLALGILVSIAGIYFLREDMRALTTAIEAAVR